MTAKWECKQLDFISNKYTDRDVLLAQEPTRSHRESTRVLNMIADFSQGNLLASFTNLMMRFDAPLKGK